MKKVLIQDIAQEVGLSRNTVAKALKNDDGVLSETRKKIINTAYNMGYSKLSETALKEVDIKEQSEVARKIAVMIRLHSGDDFWNDIMVGIVNEMNRYNGNCIINFINKEDESSLTIPMSLTQNEFDGIIFIDVFSLEYTNKIIEIGIPIIFLDSPVRKLPYHYTHDILMIEGKQSVYEITVDLIQKGCKRLGFIGEINFCQSIRDRWEGFTSAIESAGLTLNDRLCFTQPKYDGAYYDPKTLESIFDELKEIPDAFVCANDTIAILVIQYYKRKGYNLPKELAVTGFDNRKESTIIEPHITSVDIRNEEIGRKLVNQLFFKIEHPNMYPGIITATTKVCFRESSGLNVNHSL